MSIGELPNRKHMPQVLISNHKLLDRHIQNCLSMTASYDDVIIRRNSQLLHYNITLSGLRTEAMTPVVRPESSMKIHYDLISRDGQTADVRSQSHSWRHKTRKRFLFVNLHRLTLSTYVKAPSPSPDPPSLHLSIQPPPRLVIPVKPKELYMPGKPKR